MPKDTSKYIDHTKREIEEYLKAVKKSINEGNFIVCSTQKNEKNRKFLLEYRLTKNKQKQMIFVIQQIIIMIVSFHKPEKKIKKLFL